MRNNIDWIIIDILSCGFAEIDVLNELDPQDVPSEMIKDLKEKNLLSWDNIIREVFRELRDRLDLNLKTLDDETRERYEHLDPNRDMTWFINGAYDTNLYLDYYDDYKNILKSTINEIEDATPFFVQQ